MLKLPILITHKLKVLMNEMLEQIKLYILSLMFLFIIVLIMSINILPCNEIAGCIEYSLSDYLTSNWLPCLMILAIAVCEKFRRDFEFNLGGGSSDSLVIEECQSESYEHLTFLSTYIVPFLGFNFESPFRLIAYLFLLVLIGFMLIRTDRCYANPTLAIFGYKLYKANLADGDTKYNSIIIITKSDLTSGDNIAYKFMSPTTCFVRKISSDK